MKYILDSCVGLKWAFVEEHTDTARKLRDRYVSGQIELLAPDIFPTSSHTPSPEPSERGG